MPPYKGNKGNLMQHWTLCEALRIAQCHHSALNYIDAHAMAPLATCRTGYDPVFDAVRNRLASGESPYEKAWQALAPKPTDGYPNSANFVRKVWKSCYSLFLCEKDPVTYACIKDWLRKLKAADPNCACAASRCGDWRCTFQDGLPHPACVGLPEDALTVISFDPYFISKSCDRYGEDWGAIYPQDLAVIGHILHALPGGVLVQMSTYSVNGGNTQEEIEQLVDRVLGGHALSRVAKTQVKGKRTNARGNMMSLIYARDVPWSSELGHLGEAFTAWLCP